MQAVKLFLFVRFLHLQVFASHLSDAYIIVLCSFILIVLVRCDWFYFLNSLLQQTGHVLDIAIKTKQVAVRIFCKIGIEYEIFHI